MKIQIDKNNINELKAWFFNYVQGFKQGDKDLQQNILLKEEHTKKVCREILALSDELGLTDDEKRLAEIIALFHDIGRFEQYARYNTFVDRRSANHAELGVKILQKFIVLDNLEKPMKSLILRTIRYHNRAELPREETETCLFFAKLLRDADKLDIWRVVTEYYHQNDGKRNDAIELDLPDTPEFSDAVYQDLMNKEIVNVHDIKNLNDFKLLQIGWIYDINFIPALIAVNSRGYLERIRDVLPKSLKIDNIFTIIQSHFDEKLKM